MLPSPAQPGRTDAAALAGESHDERLAAARALCAGESEAEDAALEIAAEFLLDVSRHGPLGGFPPGSQLSRFSDTTLWSGVFSGRRRS